MSSLRHKVWLSITGIVVLLLAGVGFVFERSARSTADRVIVHGLERAKLTISNYERDVRARLESVNAYISGNSYFKAYMAEAIESGANQSLLDQFDEIKRFAKCDFMVVTDAEGTIVVSTATVEGRSETLLLESLESFGAGGESVSVLAFGSALFHVVMSEIAVGEAVYGYVVIGYRIDDLVAKQFSELTDCGIAFVQLDTSALISAASFPDHLNQVDRQQLASDFSTLVPNQVSEIVLDGERFKAITGALVANTGTDVGRYVAIRSIDREMGPFHRMIRSAMILGAIALLILIPLSFFVSGGIIRPLSNLTAVVDGLRQDQFEDQAIDVKRNDEIGVLGRAFTSLVKELREQRELIDFLEKAAQKTVVADPQPDTPSGGTLKENTILSGRYKILEVLGKGGMGQVYRAHDMTLDEVVALKTLYIDDPALVETLKTETKLARRVTHRNVVRTFDYHVMQGLQFVTMEYVQGRTLRQAQRGVDQLPVAIANRIIRQVCAGLHAAHEAGIIHGDVKPDNVMIDNRGVVKVMDFGVARIAKKEKSEQAYITGTPIYMAPEQIMGQPMDARTDLYSVGVMMFQVFVGRLPFQGETPTQIFHAHLHQDVPRPTQSNPSISSELELVIMKAMSKKPSERFQSLTQLEAVLSEMSS